jgi:putative PIN family toxin of toxin-antitoxin system
LARRDRVQAVTSPALIEELREVLERKLRFGSSQIELAVEIILESSELVLPQKRIDAIQTDPDDNRVLECAVESMADAIVTGDQHLLKLQNFRGISILSPADFPTMFSG